MTGVQVQVEGVRRVSRCWCRRRVVSIGYNLQACWYLVLIVCNFLSLRVGSRNSRILRNAGSWYSCTLVLLSCVLVYTRCCCGQGAHSSSSPASRSCGTTTPLPSSPPPLLIVFRRYCGCCGTDIFCIPGTFEIVIFVHCLHFIRACIVRE